jgi:hypothetical protein
MLWWELSDTGFRKPVLLASSEIKSKLDDGDISEYDKAPMGIYRTQCLGQCERDAKFVIAARYWSVAVILFESFHLPTQKSVRVRCEIA